MKWLNDIRNVLQWRGASEAFLDNLSEVKTYLNDSYIKNSRE